MAATASETHGPSALPQQQKKRPRLNPARRKSAKAQSNAQNVGSSPPKSNETQSNPSISKVEPSTETSKSSLASQNTGKPPPVQQNTEKVPPKQQTTALIKPLAPRSSNARPNNPQNGKSSSNSKPGPLALAAPAMVTGGLAGCAAGAAVILGAGLWNRFGGADSAILAARTAKLCLDNLIEEIITSLKNGTCSAPEALDMLRRTTLAYASTIPGGAPFVERLFREIDMVRRQRGREVDKVIAEACLELSKAGKRGASTAELHAIVIQNLVKLSTFAEKATQDIIKRNPNLSPYRERVVKALQPPPKAKVPTVRLNMAIQHKPTAKA